MNHFSISLFVVLGILGPVIGRAAAPDVPPAFQAVGCSTPTLSVGIGNNPVGNDGYYNVSIGSFIDGTPSSDYSDADHCVATPSGRLLTLHCFYQGGQTLSFEQISSGKYRFTIALFGDMIIHHTGVYDFDADQCYYTHYQSPAE